MKIIRGDCLEEMKKIPDNSIDCIITDPPYNISRETNFKWGFKRKTGTTMDFGEWDKNFDICLYIKELPRLLKEGSNVIIFNSWENLGKIAEEMRKNNITPKRCLVLNKSNPAPFNRERLFVNDVEFAIWGVYFNKNWTFNRIDKSYQKCIFDTNVQSRKFHPTMKDIKVIEKLIKILSKEGDIVLDPFMGSGTTGVACKNLNRDFIGIELDETYFKMAEERLK